MMLKSLVFSVVKKTSCLIGILMLVGCSKPDPLRHVSDDLEKGLGKQLFYTNEDYCDSSVYSFSDEWYENIKPIISKREWWQITPIDDDIEDGMSLKTRSFTAAWCNDGFQEYSDIFFEAIKVKGNDYFAGNVSFVLIAKKEKLLFIATAK